MQIYLSGPISQSDRAGTDNWRSEAKRLLSQYGISCLDPCRRKVFYDSWFTPNELVFRDLQDIDSCDLVLLNYQQIQGHLSIGTPCEMLYAWERKKPVVIVTTDPQVLEHPWCRAMSVRMLPDLLDAVEYIVNFWGSEV